MHSDVKYIEPSQHWSTSFYDIGPSNLIPTTINCIANKHGLPLLQWVLIYFFITLLLWCAPPIKYQSKPALPKLKIPIPEDYPWRFS